MNSQEVYIAIEIAAKAEVPIMISSSPGIGKSSIVKGFAEDHNLHLVDFRLAQCDVTDLNAL